MFSSGRPMAHPTDVFIRNVALVGLLCITSLLFWESGRPTAIEKPVVNCWFPSELTSAQVEYATHYCRETNDKTSLKEDRSQPQNKTKELDLYPSTGAENESFMSHWLKKLKNNTFMACLVTQASIVVVSFVLLRNIGCRACTQARILLASPGGSLMQRQAAARLQRSFCTAISYIIVQVCYFASMVVMIVMCRTLPNSIRNISIKEALDTHTFTCSFEVTGINVIHYSVQCVVTPPEPTAPSGVLQLAVYADTVLCGVVALLVLLHLFQTFLFCPASADTVPGYDVDIGRAGIGRMFFGCTDMNMASIFLASMGHTYVIVGGGRTRVGSSRYDELEKPSMELV